MIRHKCEICGKHVPPNENRLYNMDSEQVRHYIHRQCLSNTTADLPKWWAEIKREKDERIRKEKEYRDAREKNYKGK